MPLTILRAPNGAPFEDFLDLPYSIQGANPLWAPPLRMQQKELLDTGRHPFFKHARIELFVAYVDGRPAGRIAAINDANHNRIHNETTTHFGFFECIDDPEVARGLFGEVERCARSWGHNLVRGPFNHSVNEEIGLQVDAFDTPNYIMIPGNPPYYEKLVRGAGYDGCMDLYCYRMSADQMSAKLLEAAPRVEKRLDIRIRKADRKNFERDALRIWEVYNKAWKKNWFWLPISKEEFMLTVKDLKSFADFDLIFLAETPEGELAGFTVAIPNINEALTKIRNGRLFPFGLFRLLWLSRPGAIRTIRVLIMGVLEEHRGRGIDSVLYLHQYRAALKKGYREAEMSQVLQSNTMMNRAAQLMGAQRYKTHRIYERKLD